MSHIAGCDPLSVLIVGCGAIAGGYDAEPKSDDVLTHAKAYSLHPGFRIAGCVEPDEDLRRRFMDRWQVPAGHARLEEVTGAFDVASLCAPTDLHASLLRTLLGMEIGLVFAEKPLTADIAASRSLVSDYERSGRSLAVNYLRRFAPGIADLKREIEAGNWGELQRAVCLYTKGLLNNGSHAIDLLGFLFGALKPATVLARIDDGLVGDATLDTVLQCASGAPILLAGLNRAHFTLFEIILIFDKGRVTLANSGFVMLRQGIADSARFSGYRMLEPALSLPTGLDRAMIHALDNIHAHVTRGEPLISTGASALRCQEICAALAAMEPGRTKQGALS